jgi:hypothetical protein
MTSYDVTSVDNGKTFSAVDFVAKPGGTAAALTIAPTYADKAKVTGVTFEDITAAPIPATNAISIVDNGTGDVANITIKDWHVLGGGRMGLECISSPNSATHGVQNLTLLNGVIEPVGAEAISLCGGAGAGNFVVDGLIIKGAGNGTTYPWKQGFELNAPVNVNISNVTIYRCGGVGFNLNGMNPKVTPPAKGVAQHWIFTNCIVDWRTSYISQLPGTALVMANAMVGAVWDNCDFYTADLTNGIWLSNCQNNDFSTSRVHGPFKSGMVPFYQDGACSGNKLPTVLAS